MKTLNVAWPKGYKQTEFDRLLTLGFRLCGYHIPSAEEVKVIKMEQKKAEDEWLPKKHAPIAWGKLGGRMATAYDLTSMIAKSYATSLILCGDPGLGKSTIVQNCLKDYRKEFIVSKGAVTSKSLFRLLYENNGRIIVLDDSDQLLNMRNAVNVLKAALDSNLVRKVSWEREGAVRQVLAVRPASFWESGGYDITTAGAEPGDKLPASFEFTGKVIFISNYPLEKFPDALKSRGYVYSVAGSLEEREEYVLQFLKPGEEALGAWLHANGSACREVSLRTLNKLRELRTSFPSKWYRLAHETV
jgi:hypothetical protein